MYPVDVQQEPRRGAAKLFIPAYYAPWGAPGAYNTVAAAGRSYFQLGISSLSAIS